MLSGKSVKKLQQKYLGFVIVEFGEAKFQLQPEFKRIRFPKGKKPKAVFSWNSKNYFWRLK